MTESVSSQLMTDVLQPCIAVGTPIVTTDWFGKVQIYVNCCVSDRIDRRQDRLLRCLKFNRLQSCDACLCERCDSNSGTTSVGVCCRICTRFHYTFDMLLCSTYC